MAPKRLKMLAIAVFMVAAFTSCTKLGQSELSEVEQLTEDITLKNGMTQIEMQSILMEFTGSLLAPTDEESQKQGLENIQYLCTSDEYTRMENSLYYSDTSARLVSAQVYYSSADNTNSTMEKEIVVAKVAYGDGEESNYLLIFRLNSEGKIDKHYLLKSIK